MELFACSGPGAGAAMIRSVEIGNEHAFAMTGLFAVSMFLFAHDSRWWFTPVLVAAFLAFHPAWPIGVGSGDCGYFKRDVSWGVSTVGGFALLRQFLKTMLTRENALPSTSEKPPTENLVDQPPRGHHVTKRPLPKQEFPFGTNENQTER